MNYKCLILDHDDTCVDSTPTIHYPAFLEVMRQLRPKSRTYSLEEFFSRNYNPGFSAFMSQELKMTPEEMKREFEIWGDYTRHREPEFFPGFLEGLKDFRSRGGLITVVSHSQVDDIRRFYEKKGEGLQPEAIYGWDHDPAKRKPSPYPVEQILSRFNLTPEEVLVVDDLSPGIQMAKAAGVSSVGAGWAHQIPAIQEYMRRNCLALLDSPEELWTLIE